MRATASRAGIYGRGRRLRPPLYAASAVSGMGCGLTFPRAVSSVACVSPRSGDRAAAGQRVRLRQRMRAVLKLLFGSATTAGG
jgi:hypothetical protein